MKNILDWSKQGKFYILKMPEYSKLGITQNLKRRMGQYAQLYDFNVSDIQFIDLFDHYWQAEFVEVMVRKRLNYWVVKGKLEYMRQELPIQCVVNCYKQTRAFLEINNLVIKSEYMHKSAEGRFKHYQEFYLKYKDEMKQFRPLEYLDVLIVTG